MIDLTAALFKPGRVTATPAALDAVRRAGETIWTFVARHVAGDWGQVPPRDWAANNDAVKAGERVLSAYRTRLGDEVWVLTESNRSVTTVLLPSDY